MRSAGWWQGHWLAVDMAGWYLAFSALTWLSLPLRPVAEDVAEVLMFGLFLWPYPAMLALQSFRPGAWVPAALQIAGLALVVMFATWLGRTFAVFARRTWPGGALAALLWCVPLILFQGVLLLVARALGLPAGA